MLNSAIIFCVTPLSTDTVNFDRGERQQDSGTSLLSSHGSTAMKPTAIVAKELRATQPCPARGEERDREKTFEQSAEGGITAELLWRSSKLTLQQSKHWDVAC